MHFQLSKRYPKSDIATQVEKSSTSRAFHAHDTGSYWSSENALLAEAFEFEWKRYSLLLSVEKTLAFEYKFSFMLMAKEVLANFIKIQLQWKSDNVVYMLEVSPLLPIKMSVVIKFWMHDPKLWCKLFTCFAATISEEMIW